MHADSKEGHTTGAAKGASGWAGLRAMPLPRHNVENAAKSSLWGVLGGKTLAKPVRSVGSLSALYPSTTLF